MQGLTQENWPWLAPFHPTTTLDSTSSYVTPHALDVDDDGGDCQTFHCTYNIDRTTYQIRRRSQTAGQTLQKHYKANEAGALPLVLCRNSAPVRKEQIFMRIDQFVPVDDQFVPCLPHANSFCFSIPSGTKCANVLSYNDWAANRCKCNVFLDVGATSSAPCAFPSAL